MMGLFGFEFRRSNEQTALRDSVELLVKDGVRASDIASQLGVSLQTVAGFIKNMQGGGQGKGNKTAQQEGSVQKEKSDVQKEREALEIAKIRAEREDFEKKSRQSEQLGQKSVYEMEIKFLKEKVERLEKDIEELEEEKEELEEGNEKLYDEARRMGKILDEDGEVPHDPMDAFFYGLGDGDRSRTQQQPVVQQAQTSLAPPAHLPNQETQQTLSPPANVAPPAPNAVTRDVELEAVKYVAKLKPEQRAQIKALGKKNALRMAPSYGIDAELAPEIWKRL